MPELGETWSFLDSTSGRVEAVVIATGPTLIRLVDRFGRRITFPTSSWAHIWQFVSPAPAPLVRCHQCSQSGYFRFVAWDGTLTWSCEDHLPHGVRAHFPGDTPGSASSASEHCLRCRSGLVTSTHTPNSLPNNRSTTRWGCQQCGARWSPLLSHGLGDDGPRLAADLHFIVQAAPCQEIRIGFTAYRSLCRAVNMGDVAHIQGVPVRMDQHLGDLLTLVFYGGPGEEVPPPEEQRPTECFASTFQPLTLQVGSMWSRRTRDGRGQPCCVIDDLQAGYVIYHLVGTNWPRAEPAREFRRRWVEGLLESRHPRITSIWIHRETAQRVQVLTPTATQTTHGQVHYITAEGQHETTPVRTFQRLYRELPTPPEDHLWYCDGEFFEVEREGSLLRIRSQWPQLQPLPHAIETATLYKTCRPVLSSDVSEPVHGGTQWVNKFDVEVTVLDIALVDEAPLHVRFQRPDETIGFMALETFREQYRYQPAPAPCRVGETWVSSAGPQRQGVIRRADSPFSGEALIEWSDGTSELIPHDCLVAAFKKLDVRSYWEMLDGEDPG